MVEEVFQTALQRLQGKQAPKHSIVIAGDDWHPGIIGIVASRLVEHFYLPTIVLSSDGQTVKGSCRSIPNFNMHEALTANRSYLQAFGGHKQAAGLKLSVTELPAFRQAFDLYAAEKLQPDDYVPKLKISGIVAPTQINKALIEELHCLEPYGMGNPAPLFLCGDSFVRNATLFGRDKAHLRLDLQISDCNFKGIGWKKGELSDAVDKKVLDFVFAPEINVWQEREYLQLIIDDLRESTCDRYPDREYLRKFYLALRKTCRMADTEQQCCSLLRQQGLSIDAALFARCVQIFAEIDVLAVQDGKITFLPVGSAKKDLNDSPLFRERYFHS